MAQGTSTEDAKKLMETVSFELDTDLRLHPQKLELGKAELLTDALTLPFMDIEKRLNQFISGTSGVEKQFLQKTMKAYLAKLNANPLIPLQFRLKVLSHFERELELFDSEMTAAVLNAHKIGVDLVQKAARSQPGYYRVLVEMVANALELSVKMLRIGFEGYQAPAVLTNRQSFDLMRLGLSVVPALAEDAAPEKERLFKIISSHEFLRMLDFFGKSKNEQHMTWEELECHVGTLEPKLMRKNDDAPDLKDETFMTTNFMKPNQVAKVISSLPEKFTSDMVIIPLDKFVDRMVTAINRVETVLKSPDLQKNDLHTEESLNRTIVGGNAILDTLRTKDRSDTRDDYAGTRLIMEWDAAKAFKESHTAVILDEYEYAPSERGTNTAWSVANLSKHGVGLERISDEKDYSIGVGALVGLSWIPHKGEPMLGTVCWIKEPKPGEQRLGIQFFHQAFKLYKGVMLGGNDDTHLSRSWPVLVKPGKPNHTVVFPDCKVFKNMTFMLTHDGKGAHFKILKVMKTGPNYSFCKVGIAEELVTTHSFDFN
ncbi:MAG: hypothetical protein ABUK11_04405 [Mariprofundaceae bacterium]